MIDYFDKNVQTCYLETHNDTNVAFYEKRSVILIPICLDLSIQPE